MTVIAEEENEIAAFATLSFIYVMPTFDYLSGLRGHLMNVYTVEKFRRRGIASEVVKKNIVEAKSKASRKFLWMQMKWADLFMSLWGFKRIKRE